MKPFRFAAAACAAASVGIFSSAASLPCNYVCPSNSAQKPDRKCYDTFGDCLCDPLFKKNELIEKCVVLECADNDFVCPPHSEYRIGRNCYDTVQDCECDDGYVLSEAEGVCFPLVHVNNGAADPFWIDAGWLDALVLIGLTCFVLCLMNYSKVDSAKMGTLYGVVGMACLVLGYWSSPDYTVGPARWRIALFLGAGLVLGTASALATGLTTLPLLVGCYNGLTGASAALAGLGLYLDPTAVLLVRGGTGVAEHTDGMLVVRAVALLLSVVVGTGAAAGSAVAVAQTLGKISGRPLGAYPRGRPFHWGGSALYLICVVVFGTLAFTGREEWNDRGVGLACLLVVMVFSGAYGAMAVLAIGREDMPVSICFLHGLSGFATSAAGFMFSNKALVVSGAFVGCIGIILTKVMCNAMNRTVFNVLRGGVPSTASTATNKAIAGGTVKHITTEDLVVTMTDSKSIIIVPGYGLALGTLKHTIAAIVAALRARGITVRFAVHPLAGRLPGHMHAVLAEAGVPHDLTVPMDDINGEFPKTDLALVLGANDTVRPLVTGGMAVLEVWKARRTVVMKKSLVVGTVGADNPLFVGPNTSLILGDAGATLKQILELLQGPGEQSVRVDGDIEGASNSIQGTGKEGDIRQRRRKKGSYGQGNPFLDISQTDPLKIGVCDETHPNEDNGQLVALVPEVARRLHRTGKQVYIQTGAGAAAGFPDGDYARAGCRVLDSASEVFDTCDVLLKRRPPGVHPATCKPEIAMLAPGKTLVCPVAPRTEAGRERMAAAAAAGVNLLAVDAIPRLPAAAGLDVLGSEARIAGYRAVVEAAQVYGRFFAGEATEGGGYAATKVLVIGAGTAGMAAVGAAARMGAVVRAFDTRTECRAQVEALGGEFLVVDTYDRSERSATDNRRSDYHRMMSERFYRKEMDLFRKQAEECQILITTASIPGQAAPTLIKRECVDVLRPGSVIVDLAASSGGNCELTRPGATYVYDNRVTIIGTTGQTGRMGWQASSMYAHHMANLLEHLCPATPKGEGTPPDTTEEKKKKLTIDMDDPVLRGMTCVYNGTVTWPPPASGSFVTSLRQDYQTLKTSPPPPLLEQRVGNLATLREVLAVACAAVAAGLVAAYAPNPFLEQLLYFILSGSLGTYLVRAVDPVLHAPLLTVGSGLSGGGVLGGILLLHGEGGSPSAVLGCLAVVVSSITIFGGFVTSYRMLLLFKKEER